MLPGGVAHCCVGEALLASFVAIEPACSVEIVFAFYLLLAGQAGQGVVRHGAYAGRELSRRLSGPADGAGKFGQGAAAGRALALLVRVLLRQLDSREGLLDLGHLAAAALDALLRGGLGVEAPLPRPLAVLVLLLAGQAGGFKVGPVFSHCACAKRSKLLSSRHPWPGPWASAPRGRRPSRCARPGASAAGGRGPPRRRAGRARPGRGG